MRIVTSQPDDPCGAAAPSASTAHGRRCSPRKDEPREPRARRRGGLVSAGRMQRRIAGPSRCSGTRLCGRASRRRIRTSLVARSPQGERVMRIGFPRRLMVMLVPHSTARRALDWVGSQSMFAVWPASGRRDTRGPRMPYIIAEPCIGLKDRSCVDVCPVDCIYEGEDQLYIHPDECIDCGACEPECPVTAIFPEEDTPPQWKSYIAKNRDVFQGASPPGKPQRKGS